MRKFLDLYSTKYENIIVLGDFNVEIQNKCMMDFCKSYSFRSLSSRPTCFKNLENSSCIDLVLTNSPNNFPKKNFFYENCSDLKNPRVKKFIDALR